MMGDTRSAYRARAAATERSIDAALAEKKAVEEAELSAAATRAAERTKSVPFTQTELKAARLARTWYGWQHVVRVNRTTVTLAGDFGDYRVPTKHILEVR